MIVVDTSAIVAILRNEPEASAFATLMHDQLCVVSTAVVYEAETVMRGRDSDRAAELVRELLTDCAARIIPFGDDEARAASEAYARYGKGIHPARLNLVDCISYAMARTLKAPLLYKGDDFSQTEIASAVTAD